MQFMMFMIPNNYRDVAPDWKPDAKGRAAMVEMGKFNDEMKKAGVLKSLNGLTPPSAGVRIAFDGSNPNVKHGPFAGTTETVGGYWLLELNSQDEAIAWAKKCPAEPGDIIEIRQIAEF